MLLNYTPKWTEWFYVFAPFQIYLIIVAILVVYGEHYDERNFVRQFFKRISYSLERWTGYPGWSMAGALTGLLMLGTAAIGLYWDIGFHVDFGRDNRLLTPSHLMIVLGLGGIAFAGFIAVVFASIDKADVDLQFGWLHVPWTAIALMFFGLGGMAAFPFDAMWHDAYGVDVTLWSPSHLQLLAGGGLATIVLWLMMREGRSTREGSRTLGRVVEVTIFGAILTGLTIYQGEFDFGVPQFQVVYLPILIAAAGALALVLGRLALGRWGAVKTAFAYIIIRGVIGLLVAGPFNETFPRFPLYLVGALLVEGVAYLIGTQNRLLFAAASGAAVGTIGVLADVIWFGAISDLTSTGNGIPKAAVLSLVAGVAAAMLGAALARPVPDGGHRLPAVAALAGGLVLAAVIAYPLPRHVGNVAADIRLRTPDQQQSIVEIDITPANAATSATAFGVVSWQGGGRVSSGFTEVAPGKYVSEKAMPITGRWKTMIGLQRDDQVMAAPVYFPKDPEIFDNGFPAVADRHEVFAKNTKYLLREQKTGGAFAANAAYAGVSVVVIGFLALYVLCAVKVTRDDESETAYRPPTPPWSPSPPSNGPDSDRQPIGASWSSHAWGAPPPG
jgi:hypothetical protein